jgi:hypothetical protein
MGFDPNGIGCRRLKIVLNTVNVLKSELMLLGKWSANSFPLLAC